MRIYLITTTMSLFLLNGCNLFSRDNKRFAQIEERLAALEQAVSSRQNPAQNTPFDFPIGESYYTGNQDAKVSIVVFTNMQCPACARGDKALQQVMRDPKLKNDVKLVVKHFPFLSRSKPAVKAAFAAGEQGREHFWRMSEKIYANQADLSDANLVKWAQQLGLNIDKFSTDLVTNDAKYEEILAKDLELVKMAKINSTPSIFVGGFSYDGDLTAGSIVEFIAKKKLH